MVNLLLHLRVTKAFGQEHLKSIWTAQLSFLSWCEQYVVSCAWLHRSQAKANDIIEILNHFTSR